MSDSVLRFIPLGGVGTFGMNCAILEWDGGFLVVDAGIKIPQGNFPGVDLFLPDFTFILENKDRLRGVVLTHGHDDHIGALPFLLSRVDVPVYGTAFTLALLRERMANGRGGTQGGTCDLRQILFQSPFGLDDLEIEALRVDHSVPDSACIIFRTPAGAVVHSGDFRMGRSAGCPTPSATWEGLRRQGEEGVLALICDSTNAEQPGVTPSEEEVDSTLRDLMRRAHGRVLVATFGSHIQRMSTVIGAASAAGRKVVLEGRRVIRNFTIARDMGYISPPRGAVVGAETLSPSEAGRAVYLMTGTQGEPFSALSRVARGEHAGLKVREGDTVILSSRIIPGNELSIGQIIDDLLRLGAEVHYRDQPRVHVSGHGCAEEIRTMISLTAPEHFVPVHGDYRNLVACGRLAREAGLAPDSIHVLDPGQILEMSPGGVRLAGSVDCGRFLVDGEMITSLADPLLVQRRRMAREGLVVVVVALPRRGGRAAEPAVHSIGVGVGLAGEELDLEAARTARRIINQWREGTSSITEVKEELTSAVRGVYRRALDKRPTVLPVILEE